MEEYLKDYIDTLKALNPGSSPNHYVEEKKENYDKFYNIDQAKNFYQTFVADKFNLSKEEFISVYSIKDKEVFYTEVKSKFKMNKKTAEKLFVSIKRDFDSPLLFN